MRMLIAKLRRHRNRRILLRRSRWCVRISKLQFSLLDRRSRLFREKQELRQDLEAPERPSRLQSLDQEISDLNLRFPLNLQSEEEQRALEDLQLLSRKLITLLSRTT